MSLYTELRGVIIYDNDNTVQEANIQIPHEYDLDFSYEVMHSKMSA
jgi:hypothetical protein